MTFPSGALTLEGAYYTSGDTEPEAAVVVCHPHPQYGGDMRNLVVSVIVRGALDAGLGALTFNFRGVGRSQGAYDGGAGERDDVRAALAWLRSREGVRRVALAGYSFGAAMAAAAVDASVPALALVALPAGMVRSDGAAGLAAYDGPVLLISGQNDNISSEDALRQLAAGLPTRPEVVIVPGTDHFWWGQERALADALCDFFARHLGGPA
ncbi:MAG TPA: alpha/beta fold hydrolase [Dehalococcoidia bacterium]|nr:alpha/beta fold hydrolase [Dehalococcoidia bacterium]